MHGKSMKDVCLKVSKGLCVIIFTDEDSLDKKLEKELKVVK